MILYHGTDWKSAANIMQNGISLEWSRSEADFAAGFYTTPSPESAISRANFKADLRKSRGAVISILVPDDFMEVYEDNKISFKDADMEWAQFVVNCRAGYRYVRNLPEPLRNNNLSQQYGICKGQIADGDIKDVVSELQKTGLPADTVTLKRLTRKKYPQQYSFHKQTAIDILSKMRFNEIKKGGLHYVTEW